MKNKRYEQLASFYNTYKHLLSNDEMCKIEKLVDETLTPHAQTYYLAPGSSDDCLVFKCLYICRYKLDYTTIQISDLFGVSQRSIQKMLANMKWERSMQEAQQLAADVSRNYHEIGQKGRKTRLLNSHIGSKDEEFIRQYLKVKFDACEFETIVGCNNLNIMQSGKEVDIPILIIKDDVIHRFAVEVDGTYWHEDRKDKDKDKVRLLSELGYKCFNIEIDTQSQRKIIDKTNAVYEKIIKTINN